METIRTHEAIDRRLCGEPVELTSGRARLVLETVPEMAVDERGLVHGGFLFGLADHAAMLAVNHPNVVLGQGEMRFLRPVVVGEQVTAEARVGERDGAKTPVTVEVRRDTDPESEVVARGDFICLTLERHVLE